jgi:hypothetical protein
MFKELAVVHRRLACESTKIGCTPETRARGMVARERSLDLYLAAILCGVSVAQCLLVLRESYAMRHDSVLERGQEDHKNRRADLFHEFSVAVCLCMQ